MPDHNYFVYITTNPAKTVLYVGVTNNLFTRMAQHQENAGKSKTFAGRYYCFNLIFWERHSSIHYAISREKEIKKWRRNKKIGLINDFNADWKFLNDEI